MGLTQLQELEQYIETRAKIEASYAKSLADLSGSKPNPKGFGRDEGSLGQMFGCVKSAAALIAAKSADRAQHWSNLVQEIRSAYAVLNGSCAMTTQAEDPTTTSENSSSPSSSPSSGDRQGSPGSKASALAEAMDYSALLDLSERALKARHEIELFMPNYNIKCQQLQAMLQGTETFSLPSMEPEIKFGNLSTTIPDFNRLLLHIQTMVKTQDVLFLLGTYKDCFLGSDLEKAVSSIEAIDDAPNFIQELMTEQFIKVTSLMSSNSFAPNSYYQWKRSYLEDTDPLKAAQNDVNRQEVIYRKLVDSYEVLRISLENEMARFMEAFEGAFLLRIRLLKNLFSNYQEQDLPSAKLGIYLEIFEPQKELDLFIEREKTGSHRIPPANFNPKFSKIKSIFGSPLNSITFVSRMLTVISWVPDAAVAVKAWKSDRTDLMQKVINLKHLINTYTNSKKIFRKQSPFVIVGVLKLFLAELPDSLCTPDLYDVIKLLYLSKSMEDERSIQASLKQSLNNLPNVHLQCLYLLLQHCRVYIQKETSVKDRPMMEEIQEWALVLGPLILRPKLTDRLLSIHDKHPVRLARDLLLYFDILFADVAVHSSSAVVFSSWSADDEAFERDEAADVIEYPHPLSRTNSMAMSEGMENLSSIVKNVQGFFGVSSPTPNSPANTPGSANRPAGGYFLSSLLSAGASTSAGVKTSSGATIPIEGEESDEETIPPFGARGSNRETSISSISGDMEQLSMGPSMGSLKLRNGSISDKGVPYTMQRTRSVSPNSKSPRRISGLGETASVHIAGEPSEIPENNFLPASSDLVIDVKYEVPRNPVPDLTSDTAVSSLANQIPDVVSSNTTSSSTPAPEALSNNSDSSSNTVSEVVSDVPSHAVPSDTSDTPAPALNSVPPGPYSFKDAHSLEYKRGFSSGNWSSKLPKHQIIIPDNAGSAQRPRSFSPALRSSSITGDVADESAQSPTSDSEDESALSESDLAQKRKSLKHVNLSPKLKGRLAVVDDVKLPAVPVEDEEDNGGAQVS